MKSMNSGMIIPLLMVLLAGCIVLSLGIGRYPVHPADVAGIILSTPPGAVIDNTDTKSIIVEIVRMPRILLVVFSGAGLAMAGAAMQGVFRNPLVGPEVVGVSSGASFGGVLGILFGWSTPVVVLTAFGFGMAALVLAFLLAGASGRSGILGLVLAGVIMGSFFGALMGILQYVADPASKLPGMIFWLMGSFASADYEKVGILAAVTLTAGTLLLGLRWRINLLSLGEEDAAALGINVSLIRWVIVALVSVIVAAQVSVSGGVGWVGLVIPHIARMMVGPDHTKLLPASALLGGIYLLLMDDMARALTPQEIPIGLLTSVIGTPVFAFLFWKMQGKGWSND